MRAQTRTDLRRTLVRSVMSSGSGRCDPAATGVVTATSIAAEMEAGVGITTPDVARVTTNVYKLNRNRMLQSNSHDSVVAIATFVSISTSNYAAIATSADEIMKTRQSFA